jgi:hypothetical protein
MIKVHRIVKATTLLAAFALVMVVWAYGRPAPPPTRDGTDTVRAVRLKLTFAAGDWANVTQVEGGAIKIEKNGQKLKITPYIRDQGQVELRVFKAVQHEGKETIEAVSTLLVGKELTKFEGSGLVAGVQVLDAKKRLPSEALAVGGSTCCATTCAGTLVCGVCVCTDCGRCGPRWCECAAP